MQYELLIMAALFIGYLVYEKYENKKEKVMLIRELTVSLKSKDIIEYTDNKPIYDEPVIIEKNEDELVPLEDVDAKTLLRAINK